MNPAFTAKSLYDFLVDSHVNVSRKKRMGGSSQAPFVSGAFPDYYMNNDHFESDGWLSSTAVNSYDFKSEAINAGTYDAMQRQLLVPIHFWRQANEKPESDLKVLEIGGGTGRLMTFFRDNYPQANASLLDLSPFMLEQAGKTDRYYRKQFKE